MPGYLYPQMAASPNQNSNLWFYSLFHLVLSFFFFPHILFLPFPFQVKGIVRHPCCYYYCIALLFCLCHTFSHLWIKLCELIYFWNIHLAIVPISCMQPPQHWELKILRVFLYANKMTGSQETLHNFCISSGNQKNWTMIRKSRYSTLPSNNKVEREVEDRGN